MTNALETAANIKGPWRICRISSEFPPPWKGLAPGPYELSLAQARRGNELLVLARERGDTVAFDRSLPFKIIRIAASRDAIFSLKAGLLARRLHQRHPFHVIHAHGFSAIGPAMLRHLRLLSVPVAAHVHIVRAKQARQGLSASRISLWQERIYLNGADFLLTVSDQLASESRLLAPQTHAINVGNGANIKLFQVSTKRKTNGELRLLFVGTLNGRKGEDVILSACQQLGTESLPWRITVVGDGPRYEVFQEKVKGAGLSKKVRVLRYVDYNKMPDLYQWADVFLFPSFSEGMPKAVLEAMACGCAVILSDIPGCRELVAEGRNGFLIPPDRPDLLAEAVQRFFKDPGLIQRMGQASRSIIEQRYTWDAVAKRVEECYQLYIKFTK
ncbi:MAG: glycosyltransferase family 4 protein [Deltaproteobacteria bacterium]|nr:glycosyltransferase family 4 protein [Desulfitobacteriaceae bacterium]MDI6855027.1 glycosyltransferase family 4 protein [Deltaproteobacteria bacterium]